MIEMHENPMVRDSANLLATPPGDSINQELWDKLSEDTKRKIYSKVLMKSMSEGAKPNGVNNQVWNLLSDDEKVDILMNTHMIPAKRKSPLWSFLFDIDSIDIDYDTSFSAISIVSALLLTIPFNAINFFNNDIYEEIEAAITNCAENQPDSPMAKMHIKGIVFGSQAYISAVFFTSLIGILVSTIYFIFKPSDIKAMSKRSKLKLKRLALIGSLLLFINLFCVMVLGVKSTQLFATFYDYCGEITNVPLVLGLFFFFIVAIASFYLIA